jgi:hypothetical protein
LAGDPGLRLGSADALRSALARHPTAWVAGPAIAGGPPPRPATRVLTAAPVAPAATYLVPPAPRRRLSARTRNILVGAAIIATFIVSVLAVAIDPSSTMQAPEPVSTSTSVPPPTSSAPPLPPPVPMVELPEDKKDEKGEKEDDKAEDEGRGNGDEGNRGQGEGNGKRDKDERE